ncbi:SIR2 family protein [Xanthomonas sp. LMG 12462]|uniref:SIR2 family protein n=1 Tax=Xanthomonas sp. LMG 12462 TaxID=1591134 RepID=UPI00186AE7AD|nr:SIR2 family protein [Xanthomonas sp. LMG 12462]
MKETDVLSQLHTKRRSYSDLSRFLVTRTSEVPNFTLLLGAGCSVTSGIRTASELTSLWKEEIYKSAHPEVTTPTVEQINQYMARQESSWFVPNREYSCLFERRFDLPRQRRMFIEAEVADKNPSIGYAYLIKLVENGYLNTLFTTNFDDLINEAFFRFSDLRPIVCAHDSSVSSISITSKRPKIIKLHGDYLFDDIKSTVRETETLEENIKKKFSEFSREHGLIVAGYSGGDRSIMDVISHLLRSDDYFRHGIYWCFRKGERPSEDLLKLLWKDRVYFVEIDGFDELMAQLHRDAIGDKLPVETNLISDKPRRTVISFCRNEYLLSSNSEIIVRDIDKLKKLSERENFIDVIRSVTEKESSSSGGVENKMTDAEVGALISAKHKISMGDFDGAREQLQEAIKSASSWQAREEFLVVAVKNEESFGDLVAAVAIVDDLIKLDPREEAWLLWKANLLPSAELKKAVIDQAIGINPFSSDAWCDKAQLLVEEIEAGYGAIESLHVDACTAFKNSIAMNPSIDNRAWLKYFDYLAGTGKTFSRAKEELSELLTSGQNQDARQIDVLRASMTYIHAYDRSSRPEVDSLIEGVKKAKDAANRHNYFSYEILHLDVLEKFDRDSDLAAKITELSQNEVALKSPGFLYRRSKYHLKHHGDLQAAISDLESAIGIAHDSTYIIRLGLLYKYAKLSDKLRTLSEVNYKYLTPEERIRLLRFKAESEGDRKLELELARKIYSFKAFLSIQGVVDESHTLLLLGNYAAAEAVCKAALDKVGFNLTHAPLIINYELAKLRADGKLNKGRMGSIVTGCSDERAVACALYLLDDINQAKSKFIKLLQEDREFEFLASEWAVFQDSKGRDFLESCKADIKAKARRTAA